MLIFLQASSLIAILALVFLWTSWVWETRRPISTPEQLSNVLVHGVNADETEAFSKALSVGFVGAVAEHKRAVNFINEAADHAGTSDSISALTRISTPAPSLLRSAAAPANIDISLEFAGAKIDTAGLLSLFRSTTPKRGSLTVAVLMAKDADGNPETGTASASFQEDTNFGFSFDINGQPREIAQQLAMRYVQAHYAKDDPFFAALTAEDFRTYWSIRKQAALIALRAAGGGAKEEEKSLESEARLALDDIEHLVRRYRKRDGIQKLGAYLASVAKDFQFAKLALTHALDMADGEDRKKIEILISELESDIDSGTRPPAISDSQSVPRETEILQQQVLADLGVKAAHARAAQSGRPVRVGLVLGPAAEFSQFEDRISSPAAAAGSANSDVISHTNGVAGLVAALAPTAKIEVVPALVENFGATAISILNAMNSFLETDSPPDILLIPLGPLQGPEFAAAFTALVERGTLIILPAGNEGQEFKPAWAGLEGIIVVGATTGPDLAVFTNRGAAVDLYAPGKVTTYATPEKLTSQTGTTYSATIVAAAAANILATAGETLSPADLKARLLQSSKTVADRKFLMFEQGG